MTPTQYINGSTKIDSIGKISTTVKGSRRIGSFDSVSSSEVVVAPEDFKERIRLCRQIYKNQGLIRNFIDTQTDFVCESVEIIHKTDKWNKFFKVWAKKVNIDETINKMARCLLRDHNLVGQRKIGKLTAGARKDWFDEISASETIYKNAKKYSKYEIPIGYKFFNILNVNRIGEDYYFKTTPDFISKISRNKRFNRYYQPNAKDMIKLNDAFAIYNKKDDWEEWSDPQLACILGDIAYKNKLKLSDIVVADRVINLTRLWKLGDHKEKIYAEPAVADKLEEALVKSSGDGVQDIIWDSMISVEEHYPPIEKLLGKSKYEQVDKDILIGLGVPESLMGGSSGSKFSSSYIQLKSITEKLRYIRFKVEHWLYEEVKLVCQAMGITSMPKIKVSNVSLDDENVHKRLIISLYDRGVLSADTLTRIYGEDPEVEVDRIRKENKTFNKRDLQKLSPISPQNAISLSNEDAVQNGPGRPPGVPDQTQRTRKVTQPYNRASYVLKANKIIRNFDRTFVPLLVEEFGVSNLRQVTDKQQQQIENVRADYLSRLSMESEVTQSYPEAEKNEQLYKELRNVDKSLTLPEKKLAQAVIWSEYLENKQNA